MAFTLIIPQSKPLDASGRVSREWQQFFINLGNAVVAAGPVSNSSNLTADQVVVGDGTSVIKALAAGVNGNVLTMLAGIPAWTAAPAGGSATQVQFNTAGALAGSTNFTYNVATNTISFGGILGSAAALPIQAQAGGVVVLKTGVGANAIAVADSAGATQLAFYGASPAVQPTTAGAAAAFAVSAGTAVNDASTFDGYTLKQVVKALRTLGFLA